MKKSIPYFAFLPFLLAIAFAVKVYGEKLLSPSSETQQALVNIQSTDPAKIQLALLLDVSGSMSGLIEQAKAKLWQVVSELSSARVEREKPNLEISLYIYGGSDLDEQKGYVKQLTGFTTDLDLISEHLFALSTNGGDEYCGTVINSSLNMNWSTKPQDLRMIFIAGNEPFNQGALPYQQACKLAASKDIIVNTIFCGNHLEGINTYWKNGADLANGAYMNIDHNKSVVEIATPYDDKLVHLNSCINATYLTYGDQGYEFKQRQLAQDNNSLSNYGSYNLASRAIAKCQGNYKNSNWDLVDAIKENAISLDSISVEDMPEEFRSIDRSKWDELIAQKSTERDSLQEVVLNIDKLRKQYIAENQKTEGGEQSLDQAMLKAVREQCQRKNYSFDEVN